MITMVNNPRDWFYSCLKCWKKMVPVGNSHKCPDCGGKQEEQQRYKLLVSAVDIKPNPENKSYRSIHVPWKQWHCLHVQRRNSTSSNYQGSTRPTGAILGLPAQGKINSMPLCSISINFGGKYRNSITPAARFRR